MVFLYKWIVFTIMMGFTSEICAMPLQDLPDQDLNSNDVTSDSSAQVQNEAVEDFLAVRDKRHVTMSNEKPEILINETQSNETSFEDYEKAYLINLNKNLLEQFLHYDKYLKHLKEENSSVRDGSTTSSPGSSPNPPTPLPHSGDQTTPDVRVNNRILQQKLLELNQMDVNQLTRVFNSLRSAAGQGVEDPGITSLCCNIG